MVGVHGGGGGGGGDVRQNRHSCVYRFDSTHVFTSAMQYASMSFVDEEAYAAVLMVLAFLRARRNCPLIDQALIGDLVTIALVFWRSPACS